MALAKIAALTFQNWNSPTARANQEKMEGNEKTYPWMDENKPADKERIVELKGPQKRASELAETATESKLEPAFCSL